jgi:multiple sugar transport system ATP-binding protein
MARLELKNLNKTYSTKIVPVKDISLCVEDGEVLSLLGPSGCGKSTILRTIAGLETPTRGQISIGDRDVTNIKPGDRNIAMVFQSYALYPHMTVHENLCSGLKLKKVDRAEIDRRIAEVALVLGLDRTLMQRKPSQLSGGQQQRVALGRALVRNPDVFLLDEPLSNLDALLRERVRAELKQIFSSQSAPTVYVTHDQTEAMTLSSKIAVLDSGVVQQLDTPEQIYNHPANQFVAGFVGSPQMNLLELFCEEGRALLGDFGVAMPTLNTKVDRVVMGIRPEHIQLARQEDKEKIEGRVLLVENLGSIELVSIQVSSSKQENITLRALLPPNARSNGKITLKLPPDRIHWFDARSGINHKSSIISNDL